WREATGRLASGSAELGGWTSALTGTGGGGTGVPATTVSRGGVGAAAAIGGGPGKCGGGNGDRGFSGSGTTLTCGICRLDSCGGGSAGCLAARWPSSGAAWAVVDGAGGADGMSAEVAAGAGEMAAACMAASPAGFVATDSAG